MRVLPRDLVENSLLPLPLHLTMGLLSCFAPLLGQTSSGSSIYSDCTLVAQDSLAYGEKKSFAAAADDVVHRAVDSKSLATLQTETKARVEALRNELKKEGLQA